jgi:hypothetical protein
VINTLRGDVTKQKLRRGSRVVAKRNSARMFEEKLNAIDSYRRNPIKEYIRKMGPEDLKWLRAMGRDLSKGYHSQDRKTRLVDAANATAESHRVAKVVSDATKVTNLTAIVETAPLLDLVWIKANPGLKAVQVDQLKWHIAINAKVLVQESKDGVENGVKKMPAISTLTRFEDRMQEWEAAVARYHSQGYEKYTPSMQDL